MIYVQRMATRWFPNVFAPSALKGLPPSWSGIFARMKSPPRMVEHPKYGSYKITSLSRDEERRVAAHQFQKMLDKYPPGSYHRVAIEDYEGTKELVKKSDRM
jgi:hypothetical protein